MSTQELTDDQKTAQVIACMSEEEIRRTITFFNHHIALLTADLERRRNESNTKIES